MLTGANLRELEDRIVALSESRHLGSGKSAFLASLDMLLPPASVGVTECAIKNRNIRTPTGEATKWRADKTPYVVGIQDAADEIGVEVIAVQGPARSGKTVAAENLCVRNWIYGPSLDVIWYMQSKSDVEDYVEERVEWMLQEHDAIAAKIDWTNRRLSRQRKRIGTTLARWLPATRSTTRGKASPLIVGDEIDGYAKAVRKAILTLLRNRQREFGTSALLFLCSHADAGPQEGVYAIIEDGLAHDWWTRCLSCHGAVSPNQDAKNRIAWNVPDLLKEYQGVERGDILNAVAREARLICPHCQTEFGDAERKKMMGAGQWLQPHQTLNSDGTVTGDRKIAAIMGFRIHAMMSPFVTIGELAREWASAFITFETTGDDAILKEVNVKSLGEVHNVTKEEEKQEEWQVVARRLKSNYKLKTVPEGVEFLTAFVDVQGDRFEVVVIGWNTARESWLIDRFPIKQWPGFDTIDPANKVKDWAIIERAVMQQTYPLEKDPRYHLPIARVAIDMGGGGSLEGDTSVTQNARTWGKSIITREDNPVQDWRFMLTKGASSHGSELYGKPKRNVYDDHGKQAEGYPWERVINVHEIKRLIIKRMKIALPGPGAMHTPLDLKDRYYHELVSEKLVNEQWVKIIKANETWDGWVACDAVRASLQPERVDFSKPPSWARPFLKNAEGTNEIGARPQESIYDRLVKLNRPE